LLFANREENPTIRYYRRIFGATSTSDSNLDARSPERTCRRGRWSGAADPRQGRHRRALRAEHRHAPRLGKGRQAVEFVDLRDEDHWLSREATRQQMLSATVTFLEKNNPPN
jgi:hypothetical protein